MSEPNRSVRSFRNITILSFVLLCTISLGFIVSATANYNHYWEAKADLTASIDNIRLVKNPATGNVTTVEANVTVANPTAYQGLTLFLIQYSAYFFNSNNRSQIVFYAPNIVGSVNPSKPLGPGVVVTTIVPIELSPDESKALSALTRIVPQSQLQAHVFVTVLVDSFFDPVSGRLQRVIEQEIPTS